MLVLDVAIAAKSRNSCNVLALSTLQLKGFFAGKSFNNLAKLTSVKYCDVKVGTAASREGPEEAEASPLLLAGVRVVPGGWSAGVPGAAKVCGVLKPSKEKHYITSHHITLHRTHRKALRGVSSYDMT